MPARAERVIERDRELWTLDAKVPSGAHGGHAPEVVEWPLPAQTQ